MKTFLFEIFKFNSPWAQLSGFSHKNLIIFAPFWASRSHVFIIDNKENKWLKEFLEALWCVCCVMCFLILFFFAFLQYTLREKYMRKYKLHLINFKWANLHDLVNEILHHEHLCLMLVKEKFIFNFSNSYDKITSKHLFFEWMHDFLLLKYIWKISTHLLNFFWAIYVIKIPYKQCEKEENF